MHGAAALPRVCPVPLRQLGVPRVVDNARHHRLLRTTHPKVESSAQRCCGDGRGLRTAAISISGFVSTTPAQSAAMRWKAEATLSPLLALTK